jgi:hypothetical protein
MLVEDGGGELRMGCVMETLRCFAVEGGLEVVEA